MDMISNKRLNHADCAFGLKTETTIIHMYTIIQIYI